MVATGYSYENYMANRNSKWIVLSCISMITMAIFAIQYLLESACRNIQSEILLRLQNIQHEFFWTFAPNFVHECFHGPQNTYIDRSGRNALLDTEHALLQFIAETLVVLQGSLHNCITWDYISYLRIPPQAVSHSRSSVIYTIWGIPRNSPHV